MHGATTDGTLERGLRAVLAHHVLFHWNRLGLDPQTTTPLAHAATATVFADDPARPSRPRTDDDNRSAAQGTAGAGQP